MGRSFLKENNLWIHDWDKIPKQYNHSIDKYMQKVLKYYPKHLHVLERLTQSSSHNLLNIAYEKDLKIMQKQILKRYKKDFFRHISLDISAGSLDVTKVMSNLKSLRIYQKLNTVGLPLALRRKLITSNKRLKHLDLLQFDDFSKDVLKSMKYIRKLTGIAFQKVPQLSKAEWNKIFLKSNKNLCRLTILRDSYYRSPRPEDNIKNLLAVVLELSSLKTIQMDGRLSEYSDVSMIPFDKFMQGQISFNIRVSHTKENIKFSQDILDALNHLDLLGINLQKQWSVEPGLWNNFPDEHLKLQGCAKTLLFLHLPYVKGSQIDFSHVLFACQNISTLDLSLSEENPSILNFSCLSALSQLKHIFLTLHSFQHSYKNLFTNLALGVHKTQLLEMIALTFNKTDISNEDDCLVALFKACKGTLLKVLLDFNKSRGDLKAINNFYQEISHCSSLRSFKLIISQLDPETDTDIISSHYQNLNSLLQSNNLLEEFSFTSSDLPIDDISLNFKNSKHLKKLHLIQERIQCDFRGLYEILELAGLTSIKIGQIDLSSDGETKSKDLCRGLMKFEMLQVVEIVFTNSDQDEDFFYHVQNDFEVLINHHPNLKLVILYDQEVIETTVLKKGYCWAEADKYLKYSRIKSVVQCPHFSFY